MPYQSFIQIEKLTFTRKALIISNEGGSSLIKGDPYSLYVTICIITRNLSFNHFLENVESCIVNIESECKAEQYQFYSMSKNILPTPSTSTMTVHNYFTEVSY